MMTTHISTDKVSYKDSFVAFLDILGFSSRVKKSEFDNVELKHIEDVLDFIRAEKDENDNGILSLKDVGKRITTFSDSIIISYDASCRGAGYYMLTDISYLIVGLLNYGIVIRGALTYGKMIHDDLRCYGPALIRAYNLESEVAVNPKVLVDSNVVIAALKNPYNLRDDEEAYIKPLVGYDDGEYGFIDFLNAPYDDISDRGSVIEITLKLARQCILQNYSNEKVREKYEWLEAYAKSKL